MRRLWSWKAWDLPPWARAVLVVTVALIAGGLAYTDLSPWLVGLVVAVAFTLIGALLEAWQRFRRDP